MDSVFAFTRFDVSRCLDRGKYADGALAAIIHAANGTIQKSIIKAVPYRETLITTACYLCNTLRKRRGVSLFGAVPLLRVQESSVIVMLRRRGASRGRPVRWFA